MGGLGLDEQGVLHVLEEVAARGQLALDVHGDLDVDLLAALDGQQVDVLDVALERVALHGLRDDQRVLAVDLQTDQDVGGAKRKEQVVGRQRDVDRLGAVAVDDRGDLVVTTGATGGTLAELGTGLGGELDLGHDCTPRGVTKTGWSPGPRQACYEERVDNGPPYP